MNGNGKGNGPEPEPKPERSPRNVYAQSLLMSVMGNVHAASLMLDRLHLLTPSEIDDLLNKETLAFMFNEITFNLEQAEGLFRCFGDLVTNKITPEQVQDIGFFSTKKKENET